MRIHWQEQKDPTQLTGKMLLLSPLSKFLETQVYFDFIWENDSWRVEKADVNVIGTLADASEMNPLDDRLFVAIISCSAEILTQALETLDQVIVTGENERQIHYKWFKTHTVQMNGTNISDIYLAQMIVQNDQMVIYSKHLADLEQALDQLLELVELPLMIKAKGTDTLEHIYRTIKLQQEDYQVPADDLTYYFTGQDARRIMDHCLEYFPETWSQGKKRSYLICQLPGERHIEIQAYNAAMIVHFYHTTAETLLTETEERFRQLAQICLEKGRKTRAYIRSAQIYRPIFGDINDAEKRWRLECEQVRNKKVTYL